ncbi:MAG TPA: hypothetical protein VIH05_08785 [Tepidiformaceae bacterium]
MKLFSRKPRITEENYGRLMTSFGRVVDRDRFVKEPSEALAQRVVSEEPEVAAALDALLYRGATHYHLRLLAGAWIMAQEGSVPVETAAVFEEAVAWKFGPLVKGSGRLPHRLSELARGEAPRDLGLEQGPASG